MDVSKLPKLSQSDVPPPALVEPEGQRPIQFAPANRVAEAWISIAVGIILLLYTPQTLEYFSSKFFHTRFTPYIDPTTDPPSPVYYAIYTDGSKIYYRDSPVFWRDLVVTAFALVLIIDGCLMVRARRPVVVMAALSLTVITSVANLIYVVATYNTYGLAPVCALAVVFGVYIAISQWSVFRMLSTTNK